MTNEQFTIFMIEFEKLNSRLEKLEQEIKYIMTPIITINNDKSYIGSEDWDEEHK